MKQPLADLRVWITRPGAAARRSAESFEQLGATCIVEPVLRLEAIALSAPQRAKLRQAAPDARIVFTSANAARYFDEGLQEDPALREALLPLPVSAVGEATARAAAGLGWRVEHVASVALGLQLARDLADELRPASVILPGSDLRRPETEAQLRSDGIDVLALTVYRTVPMEGLSEQMRAILKAAGLDAVALYSPSAVQAVVSTGRDAGVQLPPAFLALGPTTAAECAELGHPSVVQPASPGEPALLDAVVQWWQQRDASR